MKPRLLIAATVALLALASRAGAFEVYDSPLDDGVNPGTPAPIPIGGGDTVLDLYVDNGSDATPLPSEPCDGTAATGDEICMWNLHITCDPGIAIVDFAPQGDVVSNREPSFIRLNGGEPIAGTLGPSRVGALTVAATGAGDCDVVGEDFVDTGLGAQSAAQPAPLASACSDGDGDGLCDGDDSCPSWPLVDPTDTNGDGIPDECQCGDVNGDGSYDALDSFLISACSSPNPAAVCGAPGGVLDCSIADANNDGACNVLDAFIIASCSSANPAAVCSSPGGVLPQCARRPEPGLP